MTPRPGSAPAAIAATTLALRATAVATTAATSSPPGDQATSTPTTTDEKWGQIRPSRWGHAKSSFSRPVFHRLERRIRAHILLCWLALLMIRLAERTTNQTWRRIALDMQRLHLVTLTGPVGSVTHTTTLTAAQREILTALKVDPPSRVTTLTPA